MIATLIGMGTLTFACGMIEPLLAKNGKIQEAKMLSFVNTAMLVGTCVGTALKAFAEIGKLGA